MKLKYYLSILAIAAIIASCSKGSTGPQGEQGPQGPVGKVNDTTESFSISASGSSSGLTWTYNGAGGYTVSLPTINGFDPTKSISILLSVDGGNNWYGLPYIGTTSGTGGITDVDIDYSVNSKTGIELLYLPQTGSGNLSSAPAALVRATY